MKFSRKGFFCKRDRIHRNLRNLVTFAAEVLNGNFVFLCSVSLHSNFLRNRKKGSHFQVFYEKINGGINAKIFKVSVKKFENVIFAKKFFKTV